MIILAEQQDYLKHSDLLSKMFRLRARVFHEKLKWNVIVRDGMERDKYDDEGPAYLISTDRTGKRVVGSLRLLPTTGPTLLADEFAESIPNGAQLVAPSIWECTRFCVDEDLGFGDREYSLLAAGELLKGLGEVALRAGIETILGNFDPLMLRVYRRIGCEVEILGSTLVQERPVYLGAFHVSKAHLGRIAARLEERRSSFDRIAAAQGLAA